MNPVESQISGCTPCTMSRTPTRFKQHRVTTTKPMNRNRDYTGMWVRLGSTDLMAGKVVFLRGLLSPIRVVDLTKVWKKKKLSLQEVLYLLQNLPYEINDVLTDNLSDEEVPASSLLEFPLDT
ncbi:hypothetical protein TNCV_4513311 [Trichonephila clavipes]|nr:hypothetical protein TNCV_4513311 [Trichonephila clavipes]